MHYLYFVDYKKKVLTIVDDAFIRKLEYDVSFDCTKEKKWYGLNKIYSMNANSLYSFYTYLGSFYNEKIHNPR